MQPYRADHLARLAAAWLAGCSDEAYRAKSEGRERNEVAASERVRGLAVAQIGVAAFESARAGDCTLGDDQIAALAFASTDMR